MKKRKKSKSERIKKKTGQEQFTTQPDKVFVDTYDLPAHYNETRLTLMAKDPHWIFAYWDIMPEALSALRRRIGDEREEARVILRMYDVTYIPHFDGTNANSSFDFEVDPHANNWYINLWADNSSYCGEIGLRASDGRFYPLTRSNYVRTPRAGYSPRTEQIWMEVKSGLQHPPYVVGRSKVADSKTASKGAVPQQPPTGQKKIYLTEGDVKHYYATLTPLLRDIISSRLARIYKRGKDETSFILEGESEKETKRLYEWLPKGDFIRKTIIGSSEILIIPGASEFIAGGASEFVQEKKEGKFFFEIGTELIIYGRTEADAEVWLGDKKIQLRNDGTFSLRYSLPDGKIPLEFKAISKDKKHTRKITTAVERHTTKSS